MKKPDIRNGYRVELGRKPFSVSENGINNFCRGVMPFKVLREET